MLKGINKQIIEIRCTNNECFDKILLFVNSEKSDLPPEILRKQAVNTVSDITKNHCFSENRKIRALPLAVSLISAALLAMLIIALCM